MTQNNDSIQTKKSFTFFEGQKLFYSLVLCLLIWSFSLMLYSIYINGYSQCIWCLWHRILHVILLGCFLLASISKKRLLLLISYVSILVVGIELIVSLMQILFAFYNSNWAYQIPMIKQANIIFITAIFSGLIYLQRKDVKNHNQQP